MSSPMAFDARAMVFKVAEKAGSGATMEAKKRFVERELGYPGGSWRIHAAWYLQAGSWSAQAMRDLQDRFQSWREREAARAASATEMHRRLEAQRDAAALEAARRDHLKALAAIELRLSHLNAEEP